METRKPGEAKVDPEEKVRSPDPGAQHGSPAPTRSHSRDDGTSVAGLRNCEVRMVATVLWVGLQPEVSQKRRGQPTQPPNARLVTEDRVGGRRFESFGRRPLRIFGQIRFCTSPAIQASYLRGNASAIANASCAPAAIARAHSTSHAATPSGVPSANPRAPAR